MSPDDIVYYTRRAETERRNAETSIDPAVAITHRRLAWEYDKRVQSAAMPRRATV